jgi:hypothetical protein
MKKSSSFLVAIAIFATSFSGCKEDSGFRAITCETEIGTFNTTDDYAVIALFDVGDGYAHNSFESNTHTKNIISSTAISYSVGSNVPYKHIFESYNAAGNNGVTYDIAPLPCDITFRIKSDNRTVYEKKYKKGESGERTPVDGNLIVR